MKKSFITIAAALCLSAILPAAASALSPPVLEKGDVFFSNAGRIVSIKADGSARKVLTRKEISVGTRRFDREILGLGDNQPAVSPDGEKLAFIRSAARDNSYPEWIMVGRRDGTGLKKLVGSRDSYFATVDWTPDGRLLYSVEDVVGKDKKGRDRYQHRLMTMEADGSDRKVLLASKVGSFLVLPWLEAQELTSDGNLLYVRSNLEQTQLRLRNLESGQDRLVSAGGREADLSPDGRSVVFVPAPCLEDDREECKDGKWLSPGIWTVNIDGSGKKRLVGGRGYFGSPNYSPSGDRIVFASSRNYPRVETVANEIYSITSDGKCLTWLTNGSPASSDPSWAPETDRSFSPRACGAADRKPLVEIKPLPARKSDPRPRLWAGPEIGNRLLSSLVSFWPLGPSEGYLYGDCSLFDPKGCKSALAVETTPLCGSLEDLQFGERFRVIRKRGVPVYRTWNRNRIGSTAVVTGRAGVAIGESFFFSSRGKNRNTFKDHLEAISLLRPVGGEFVPGSKLPAPVKKKCGD